MENIKRKTVKLPFYVAYIVNPELTRKKLESLSPDIQLSKAVEYISSKTKDLLLPLLEANKDKIENDNQFWNTELLDAYEKRRDVSSLLLQDWYVNLPKEFRLHLLTYIIRKESDKLIFMLYEKDDEIYRKFFGNKTKKDWDIAVKQESKNMLYYNYANPFKKDYLSSMFAPTALYLRYEDDEEIIKFALENNMFEGTGGKTHDNYFLEMEI